MVDYLSRTVYPEVASSEEDFPISFPYLLKAHVLVSYQLPEEDSVAAEVDVDYEYTSGSLIHWLTARPDGATVTIRRSTPNDDLLDRLSGGSTFSSDENNLISTQLLYLIQEALDSGLTLESEEIGYVLRSVLSDLRWTYDISLAAYDLFATDAILGPVPVTRKAYLAAGAPGSYVAAPIPTEGDHIFAIEDNAGDSIGQITIAETTGEVTWEVLTDWEFLPGQGPRLRTTQEGYLPGVNLGVTLRLRRTDILGD